MAEKQTKKLCPVCLHYNKFLNSLCSYCGIDEGIIHIKLCEPIKLKCGGKERMFPIDTFETGRMGVFRKIHTICIECKKRRDDCHQILSYEILIHNNKKKILKYAKLFDNNKDKK